MSNTNKLAAMDKGSGFFYNLLRFENVRLCTI